MNELQYVAFLLFLLILVKILANTKNAIIPQRDYWLSKEHRPQLTQIMERWAYFIGTTTNVFLIYVFYQTADYHIGNRDVIGSTTSIVPLVFVLVMLGAVASLLVRLSQRG